MTDKEESSSDESIEPLETNDKEVVVEPIKEEPIKEKKTKKKKVVKEEVVEPVKAEPIKKKKGGRPPKPLEEKLAKQVIRTEKIIYMVQNEKGEFEKAKPMGIRDLKKIDLKKEKEKKEIELGKKLIQRKNGKIDTRSSRPRSEAQIEATRKMVEMNKKKKQDRLNQDKKDNKEIVKESVKESVKEVLAEPFYEPKPVAPPDPYANLRF